MDALRSEYSALTTQYNSLIDEAVRDSTKITPNFSKIVEIAQARSSLVDRMLEQIAMANQDSVEIQQLRDELVVTLQRIQRDYNGLQQNTDKVATLHRIRSFQDESWKSTLMMYIIALVGVAVIVFFVVLFARQRDNTNTSPSAATIRPPLM
jgi:uncharacterized protein YbcI